MGENQSSTGRQRLAAAGPGGLRTAHGGRVGRSEGDQEGSSSLRLVLGTDRATSTFHLNRGELNRGDCSSQSLPGQTVATLRC